MAKDERIAVRLDTRTKAALAKAAEDDKAFAVIHGGEDCF